MLSRENNELLTRVGPGTAMGDLLRQYWIPALISSEVEPDGAPVRVRLLGEDLIAFRDTGGRVGMLGDHCSHRGASLFFGRNEEEGLRCVYHGWKYDVHGRCVDMPNEPPESSFRDKIRHTAYPCRERGGIIWTYMGRRQVGAAPGKTQTDADLGDDSPGNSLPPLPELEFTLVPEDQILIQKRVQFCNWVQALEGDIDQSHVGFLHSRVPDHAPPAVGEAAAYRSLEAYFKRIDRRPRYALVDTPYGVRGCATRSDGSERNYYRVSHFLMPFHTITPPGAEPDPSRSIRAWVPMDDDAVMVFGISYHPSRPFDDRARERLKAGAGANWVGEDHLLPATTAASGRWLPQARRGNDYLIDRDLQRSGPYSGIPEFWAQDAAMQESMGSIYDRSREHLGTADLFVVRMRQRLLDAARALRDQGAIPPGVDEPAAYRVRGVQVVSPNEVPWAEATRALCGAVPGTNPGGAELGLLTASSGAPGSRLPQ
ncbi:MAG: Rieske 2Fe-2S domain-containing protein [Chloroflexi bacterium]|nr:Rieske 2Fe-2S domain-containing protein [Chloroflexota bacterium]